MTIILNHFDTKLQINTGVKEEINNSLAEYLFADTKFAIGHIYEQSKTPEDLQRLEGMSPQFSNGLKVYFASDEVREKVYPQMSDGAAYGSLIFTPCQDFKELQNLRILVIDDETGENGEIIPLSQGKKLVGDCYGRMRTDLAQELTGNTTTPFQFRLGIKPQENNNVHRIAKGTLAPSRQLETLGQPKITQLSGGQTQVKIGYDLVLATSSFKGRKDATQIQPGAYTLTVGIGVKTLARYGKHSLGTQVLVNYPQAVETDIIPRLNQKAEQLVAIQSDPRKIAQYFLQKHAKRLQLTSANPDKQTPNPQPIDLKSFDDVFQLIENIDQEENLDSEPESHQNQSSSQSFYSILKNCVDYHPQLLEHPNIVSKLRTLIRNEWMDIATGRAIEFQSGLAQPSLDLKKDEICVPYIAQGEKLIVTRSPLVNSNGVIILTNRHLKEFQQEQGTVHIHPETAATYLQADFDGDRLAYSLAKEYPTLAAEVEQKQHPLNRHADVIKAEKQEYIASTFAEIALAASSNQIGIIANDIQKAVTLECETQSLPPAEKRGYLQNLAHQFRQILANGEAIHHLDIPDAKKPPCLSLQEKLNTLATYTPQFDSDEIENRLQIAKRLFFETVDVLSNELQTAVDGAKSAARPNQDILTFTRTILNVRDVEWIRDKKSLEAFDSRPMKSGNYSPIDRMIQLANQFWSSHQLESLPTHQFANFFDQNYTQHQERLAQEIVSTYNSFYASAVALKNQAQNEPGPQLIATSATSGKSITLTNLIEYNHPNVWTSKSLTIRLSDNPHRTSKTPHPLMAEAQVLDSQGHPTSAWLPLGTVSFNCVNEQGLRDGMILKGANIKLQQGITPEQIAAKFKEAITYADRIRTNHAHEQEQLQAAIWHSTHSSDQKGYEQYSRASAAFNIFPELVADRARAFQFSTLTLSGIHHPTNEWGQQLNHQDIEFSVELETRNHHPNWGKRILVVDGKQVSPFSEKDYQLPIGTMGKGTLIPAESATLVATTSPGNWIKIGQLRQHDFAGHDFSGQAVTLTIDFKTTTTKSGRTSSVPVAKIGDKILGVIDAKDRNKLLAGGRLKRGASFTATLHNNPATTAELKIQGDSLNYPEIWVNKNVLMQPNPLENLQPINSAVATHQQKDIAMADVATQFIGKSAAPAATPSSTRNYAHAWGDRANTGEYSPEDIIMVSGSGPWRGVTTEQIQHRFDSHYKPFLDKAIKAGSAFVVGNAKGTDKLVQEYLKQQGYKLESTKDNYIQAVKKPDMSLDNPSPQKKVVMYCDGSSLGNPGQGGWGVVLSYTNPQTGQTTTRELSGADSEQTTNSRMEILAAIKGLEAIQDTCEVEIHTDSNYLIGAMQGNKRKANQDLLTRLDELSQNHQISWHHVKGHSGNTLNERCDQLAKQAARAAQRLPETPPTPQVTPEDASVSVPQEVEQLQETVAALKTQVDLQNRQIALLHHTIQELRETINERTLLSHGLDPSNRDNFMQQIETLSVAIADQLKRQGYQFDPEAQMGQDGTQKLERVSPDSPGTETAYQRPDWEKQMVKAAFSLLNPISPDSQGRRISRFGCDYIAIYTDTEREKSLKILDANGDRGLLYKAYQGKPPSVDKFSSAEKQAFHPMTQKEVLPEL